MEIKLFWQRSNYFLALNTALALGFFTRGEKYAVLLAVFGAVASILWFRVNLGSKYWQSRWERRLTIVEEKVAPGWDLFSASPDTIEGDVKESLATANHRGGLRRWIDGQVLSKPSVSYSMIQLSGVFLIAWIALFIVKVV